MRIAICIATTEKRKEKSSKVFYIIHLLMTETGLFEQNFICILYSTSLGYQQRIYISPSPNNRSRDSNLCVKHFRRFI